MPIPSTPLMLSQTPPFGCHRPEVCTVAVGWGKRSEGFCGWGSQGEWAPMGGGISKRSKNQDAEQEKENDPNLAPNASAITDENGGALSARSPTRGVLKGGTVKGVRPSSTEDDPTIQPSHAPADVPRAFSPMASVRPNRKQRGKLALRTAKPLSKDYRPEVLHMAEALGINPFEEQDVMWIAEKVRCLSSFP